MELFLDIPTIIDEPKSSCAETIKGVIINITMMIAGLLFLKALI